jgi:hypothetical protein
MLNTDSRSDPFTALITPDIDYLFRRAPRSGVPSAWYSHVPFAQWIVATTRPRALVELGTHSGVSYAAFCDAVQREHLSTRCYAVDTWQGDQHAGFYGEEVFEDISRFHRLHYAQFSELLRMTFDDALTYFEDGSVDLLHIDGCHSYEAVRGDFVKWRPKLSDQSIVLFHDTNVRERNFGVWKLWADLRREYPSFEFLHGHGLGVLQVGQIAPASARALCALQNEELISLIRQRFAMAGERCVWESEAFEHKASLARTAAELNAAREAQEALRREIAYLSGMVTQHECALAQYATELRAIAAREQATRDESERVSERARYVEERLERVTASTVWQATWPVRMVGAALPSSIRRAARVGLRTSWRVLTPWWIPARRRHRARVVPPTPLPPQVPPVPMLSSRPSVTPEW